ncbi:hypothetical protein [Rhodanobacter umsongensis]
MAAALSAAALYAAAPHSGWTRLRGHPRLARVAGWVLALLSLLAWLGVSGGAAGLCAMLVSWMLALVAQPYLALLFGATAATSARETG